MWHVRYAGWEWYDGEDEEEAYEQYLACGPYGTIWED